MPEGQLIILMIDNLVMYNMEIQKSLFGRMVFLIERHKNKSTDEVGEK